MPYLQSFGSLIPFILIVGSFIAMVLAFRPTSLKRQARQGQPHRWQRIILVCILLVTIAGSIEFGRALVMCFLPPQFSNDGTSLDTNAAVLLLEGRNPYTDSNMLDLARRFPIQPNWTTPLEKGQFANRLDYPRWSNFRPSLTPTLRRVQHPNLSQR